MNLKLTWRIWLLIIFLIFSLLAIFSFPPLFLSKGVEIQSVEPNSSAFNHGLRQGQIIKEIDGITINNLKDFTETIKTKTPTSEKIKTQILTNQGEFIIFSNTSLEITVSEVPKTNIKTGLDLTGGARAMVRAKNQELTSQELLDLIDVTRNRLNVYGLSDVKVLPVSDLNGNKYMLIEVAGATPQDLKDLISQQGKFEAKIGNETAFIGGKRDIESVCSSPQCSGIQSCTPSDSGEFCNFAFSIYLSEESAKRHAEITKKLDVNMSGSADRYLSKPLELLVDDVLVDTLLISEDLKGRVTTQIQISGSGSGATREEAFKNTEISMHKLQTILKTGSLPYQLEIIKLDTVSPKLGQDFIRSILLAGFAALLAVCIIIFIRYRKIKESLALLFTSVSEIIIILGFAALINWNLDLLSIAGILATISTGIDQQIIILDESRQVASLSIKQKMKRALAIILGAFFTGIASLIPLWWAGAGLLKGFVFTTIIGITIGILITRPAFSDMVKTIEE